MEQQLKISVQLPQQSYSGFTESVRKSSIRDHSVSADVSRVERPR